jgi:hypothetical protein
VYNYRIKLEYTNDKNVRETTYEVDGVHDFLIKNAKDAAHKQVTVECTGEPPPLDTPISHILFKLNP